MNREKTLGRYGKTHLRLCACLLGSLISSCEFFKCNRIEKIVFLILKREDFFSTKKVLDQFFCRCVYKLSQTQTLRTFHNLSLSFITFAFY